MERIRVIDCAKMVCDFTGHKAEMSCVRICPPGPSTASQIIRWQRNFLGGNQKFCFSEGLKRTIDWYYATRDEEEVKRIFARILTER